MEVTTAAGVLTIDSLSAQSTPPRILPLFFHSAGVVLDLRYACFPRLLGPIAYSQLAKLLETLEPK